MCCMLCWHSRPTSINCRISTERRKEAQLMLLLFAEVQVTRKTLLKLARINICSKLNSKSSIYFAEQWNIFPGLTSPSHISISGSLYVWWPWVIKISSWWRVCSLPFPLPVSHITNCHVTGVTRAQSKQEMSGPACDRTQATEPWTPGGWPDPALHP